MAPPRVVDVENALVGREGQAVGNHEVVHQQRDAAQVGCDAVDAGVGQVPLLGRRGQRPRVGEVDAAVGLHHHVVGAVEAAALEAGGHHGDAAVGLGAGDAAAVVLAGNEPALQVAGQAVGAVGWLVVNAGAPARHELDAAVVVDVAEQQVSAVGPPHRPLGRAVVSTVVVGRVPRDLGIGGNDAGEFRGKLLDRHNPLPVLNGVGKGHYSRKRGRKFPSYRGRAEGLAGRKVAWNCYALRDPSARNSSRRFMCLTPVQCKSGESSRSPFHPSSDALR